MGRLRCSPESNGPPGERRLVGPAGEPLVLACGNLPVCPECAAHPAPRDGYLCGALTRAGRALTPGGIKAGQVARRQGHALAGILRCWSPEDTGSSSARARTHHTGAPTGGLLRIRVI